jgi:UDP-N-acetylmuramate dehydrogenase
MSAHTTFKTGGPADFYIALPPENFAGLAAECFAAADAAGLPVFILGGGANLCVSDSGIRGLVLDTGAFSGCLIETAAGCRVEPAGGCSGEAACGEAAEYHITVRSGTLSDETARFAAAGWLGGLEFLAGLPGTIGGALVMNARCFDREISDVLVSAEYLGKNGEVCASDFNAEDWDYKKSPFQNTGALILSAKFRVTPADSAASGRLCETYRRQRGEKGHYRLPSAGSVFKNNRAHGNSAGAIIEELGLRGTSIGGAQIAPWHGNFIVNTGDAKSADIRALVELVKETAQSRLGIEMEEEVLFVGEW